MHEVTITVPRESMDITVVISDGEVIESIDEDGNDVVLTESEEALALALAESGHDETGR